MRLILSKLIRLYQVTLSVVFTYMGVRCRFHPSCSHYAKISFQENGLGRATWLTLCRLIKCNPMWNGAFIDFPPKSGRKKKGWERWQ